MMLRTKSLVGDNVLFFFLHLDFFLYSPIQSWLPQSDSQKARGPFSVASAGTSAADSDCPRSVK